MSTPLDLLRQVLASIQVGDDLQNDGLCWMVTWRTRHLRGTVRREARHPFDEFVGNWLDAHCGGKAYAGEPGVWTESRVALLAALKEHFGVAP
jgi:hypothetical protein